MILTFFFLFILKDQKNVWKIEAWWLHKNTYTSKYETVNDYMCTCYIDVFSNHWLIMFSLLSLLLLSLHV